MLFHRVNKVGRAASVVLCLLGALAGCKGPTSSEHEVQAGPETKTQGDTKAKEAPAAAGGSGLVAPSELAFVESKVIVDKAEGDPKKDAFNYFKLWGEVKNNSSQWIEEIRGDIRYFDASGKELGIDSIGTAVKQDIGDSSPGEPVSSEVMYIPPGGSAPLHHIRSLNKIGGTYGSYKITLRPARIATQHPEIVLEGQQDVVATVANESLPNASPLEHRVISGTLKNKGALGCRNPGLVVAFYDASGKLADIKDGDAAKDTQAVLPIGSSLPVKVFTLVGSDDAWKAKATFKTFPRCQEPY